MGIGDSGYKKLFPKRFWSVVAASRHDFAVVNSWHRPFELVQLQSGELAAIEPSVYCTLLIDGKSLPLLIPEVKYLHIANIMSQLAHLVLFGGTDRARKYLALFKIYETICSKPDIRFAALRHALAHAVAVLNRPKTVNALKAEFGTIHVDLSVYKHQVTFWRIFGDLLVQVDGLVASMLHSVSKSVSMPKRYRQPLTNSVASWNHPDAFKRLLSNRTPNPDARKTGAHRLA